MAYLSLMRWNCLRASSEEGYDGDHDRIMGELSRITVRVPLIARAYGNIKNGKDTRNVNHNEGMFSIESGGDCCYLGSEGAKQQLLRPTLGPADHGWRQPTVITSSN